MISVFTPSHQPQWLDDCWASLQKQTDQDFEWVVVLNGGAEWPCPDQSRVAVYRTDETGVGALKARACSLAKGDILVELDHDDILAPNCLEELRVAFDANPEASLVYSDSAQVNEDLSKNTEKFAEGNGWTYRDSTVDGREVMVCESKPPTPHNVSYIWYAPNHVRAFRASAYSDAGGYDADRFICDDADLMCRLYQVGPFVHIPLCLYLQRLHPANTQRDPKTNADIQAETVKLYDNWVQPLALTWAKREDLPCVDLGGAHDCPPGYEPVDQALGVEVFSWLSDQKDDSVGVIRAVDFLEHIADQVGLMNELYRVLAPGGMLLSMTPSTDGRGAFCDPTHVSFWNEMSFRYYVGGDVAQKYVPAVTARFRQSRLLTFYPSDWHTANHLPYTIWNATKD